ncbi:uncharacterized protein LOC132607865 [Lycium barbarum]|uniref:uncharacterized protein LOC132607865 n=1 Tax=Lycium barbarum TaxID=112863 RepID=UPI00293EEC32|nr:uncharacterized protein LOC132607865 [Lycium barbarum]
MEKISYARILVETDVSQPLVDSIEITTPSSNLHQPVDYDWRPKFCSNCMRFGHMVNDCWNDSKVDFQDVPKRMKRNRNRKRKNPRWDWLAKEHPDMPPATTDDTGSPSTQAPNAADLTSAIRGEPSEQAAVQVKVVVSTEPAVTNSTGATVGGPGEHVIIVQMEVLNEMPTANVVTTNTFDPWKQKEVRLFLQKYKVDVIGCLETRIKQQRSQNILRKLAQEWNHCCNYPMDYNGRIWLLWRPHVQMHIPVVTEQCIHCKVENTSAGVSTSLTVVYAKNDAQERQILWRDLVQIGSSTQGPWLISGDFNNVLSSEDNLGPQLLTLRHRNFEIALMHCNSPR